MDKSFVEAPEQKDDFISTLEFREVLENLPEGLEKRLMGYLDEGIRPFVDEVESLVRINRLKKEQKEYAYDLLLMKDKKNVEFKYSFKEVLGFIAEEEF